MMGGYAEVLYHYIFYVFPFICHAVTFIHLPSFLHLLPSSPLPTHPPSS